jgi:hypothetical protein
VHGPVPGIRLQDGPQDDSRLHGVPDEKVHGRPPDDDPLKTYAKIQEYAETA